ncbi:MAG: hypothetical protein ACFCD0_27690 [Gemmataceae bacterium]
MSQTDQPTSPTINPPDRLTIFAFLWACQALVHQEFYSEWLPAGNPSGWVLTILAMGVLISPRSLLLFSTMLFASAVYNIIKWPFVVNHIFAETILNLTMLAAIGPIVVFDRVTRKSAPIELRNRIYDAIAPVLMSMLVVVYYYAVIAKLNWDFFDPDYSCVVHLYHNLVSRFPFVPTDRWAHITAIWLTVVIELAIPVLLTFRRTKYLGVIVGMGFHVVMGLIGHRTFSAFAYALYGLFLMGPLSGFISEVIQRVNIRLHPAKFSQVIAVLRAVAILALGALIGADWSGHYRSGVGPFVFYRASWVIWILWSLTIAGAYIAAMLFHWRSPAKCEYKVRGWPRLLWVVALNGLSQYVGFKTETCFTMYSNLRTEGGVNNHLFMPALRMANYQDDLVEILYTDHCSLRKYQENGLLITYFEFRRILSRTRQNCTVTFRRNGVVEVFRRQHHQHTHPELTQPHPLWLSKLLYFRPVPKGQRMPCQH